MLWFCLLLSIVIGLIRGGKIKRFGYINLKTLWLFIIAIVIQLFIILFGANGNSIALDYIKELYIASYVLLFIGILFNIRNRSLIILLIGGILNILTFIFNGGKMPVSVEGLKLAGKNNIVELVESGKLALYTPLTESTRYGVLGQIITVQKPFPYPQILSIGDAIILIGLFIFIQSIMLDENLERRRRIKF